MVSLFKQWKSISIPCRQSGPAVGDAGPNDGYLLNPQYVVVYT